MRRTLLLGFLAAAAYAGGSLQAAQAAPVAGVANKVQVEATPAQQVRWVIDRRGRRYWVPDRRRLPPPRRFEDRRP